MIWAGKKSRIRIRDRGENSVFSGHVHLANITVGGILDLDVTYFSIDACDVSPLCLVADLLMNALSLTTGYDIDVTLFDTLHVFGKGDIR